ENQPRDKGFRILSGPGRIGEAETRRCVVVAVGDLAYETEIAIAVEIDADEVEALAEAGSRLQHAVQIGRARGRRAGIASGAHRQPVPRGIEIGDAGKLAASTFT